MGIRDLKNHTSAIMRLTRRGETITMTNRNRPVAVIVPLIERSTADLIRELAKTGRVSWSGGKPKGAKDPARVRGPAVSDVVVQDRR